MRTGFPTIIHLCAVLTFGALASPVIANSTFPAPPETVAQAAAERQIGKPLDLRLDFVNVSGDWAFVLARMTAPDGAAFDFSGTYLAEAAAVGGASDVVCSLLRREGTIWVVVDSCLGATDVAWDGWHLDYDLPEDLFRPRN